MRRHSRAFFRCSDMKRSAKTLNLHAVTIELARCNLVAVYTRVDRVSIYIYIYSLGIHSCGPSEYIYICIYICIYSLGPHECIQPLSYIYI